MDLRDLAYSYITWHNQGVESGDFSQMLTLFHHEAEFNFEGIDYGPFSGLQAIAEAFKSNPPTDELEILGITEDDAGATIAYGWRERPGVFAGTLRLETEGRLIKQLVVRISST